MKFPVVKKKFAILGIVILLYLILLLPLIFINLKKPQELQSKAATASSILYFEPVSSPAKPIHKKIGDTITLNVMLNPGKNLPSAIKLQILIDQAKLKITGSSAFAPNTSAFPVALQGPLVDSHGIMVALSIGIDPTKAIQTTTRIGTLTLTAVNETNTQQAIAFGKDTSVVSLAGQDKALDNVLATTNPAFLLITK